jgi:hypothetical protein
VANPARNDDLAPFKGRRIASLRKPTVCVPKAMRNATAWNPAALTFAPRPATKRCGQGYYCKEHIAVINEGRDVDEPCEAI